MSRAHRWLRLVNAIMNALSSAVQTIIVGAAFCAAASPDLEKAILSFPKLDAEKYRPDLAVRSANALIAAGPQAAIAALENVTLAKRELEENYQINEKVCHLARLLFTPTNVASELLAPRLGAPAFLLYNSMDATNWPDLPFLITNGIPLSFNIGYIMVGMAERSYNYLSYCKANGAFRTELFPTPTYTAVSNALGQLFDSQRWKSLKWEDGGLGWHYKLDESYAKEMLWKQADNMKTKVP